MKKTGWSRFADYSDDGYYCEPLSLRDDTDSGAIVHLARKREREHVVAYLQAHGYDTAADDIEEGRHYDHRPVTQDFEDQESSIRTYRG